MRRPLIPEPPALQIAPLRSDPLPGSIGDDECPLAQRGGRSRGRALLRSFLSHRVRRYARGLSSPLTAPSACSRLSPYLTYGALSLREVVQATRRALERAQADPKQSGRLRSLQAFEARLSWRSHFIQRLESLPSIEFEPMHPALANERTEVDPILFEAWAHGRTGYPFVDACMRMLHATGWLNFRMRAMLTASRAITCGSRGARLACTSRGCSWITSQASTGAKSRCRQAAQASARSVSTMWSSSPTTRTRRARSSADGFPNWRVCLPRGFMSRTACQ